MFFILPIRPVLQEFYFFSFAMIEKELQKVYFEGKDMAVWPGIDFKVVSMQCLVQFFFVLLVCLSLNQAEVDEGIIF